MVDALHEALHEAFSSFAGFFRIYELVLIAADERDILRLRTDVRRETVSLFPIREKPDQKRKIFLNFLRQGELTP